MNVTFKILRFDPERDSKPHWESYRVEMEPTDRVLDGLEAIKGTLDGSLSLRRSCAHGVCGSDAMMINGRNRLACKVLVKNLKQPICVEPMRGFRVIKDLIVDMEPFFAKYRKVKPFLIEGGPAPEKERLQSPAQRERFDDTTKCILCGGCTTSCPSFWANPDYVGPAAIVQAHRFVFDSRDAGKEERLEVLNRNDGVWRCRTVFNCVEACPRGINVTRAIAEIKRALIKGLALSLIGVLLPVSWALPAADGSGPAALRGLSARESPPARAEIAAGLEEPSGAGSAERWDQFRDLLRRAAVGPDRERARELLLKEFGEVSEGQGGVDRGIPRLSRPTKEAIAIYLFAVPAEEPASPRRINLTIPSRFGGQRLRLIPAAGPQGELMLKEYVRQPPILFREVRWRDSPPGWVRLLPTRQERLREVRVVPQPAGREPVDPEEDYDPDFLEEELDIPPDLVDRLEEGGYLYRNAAGWIPGELAALIARTVSEMDRESYPLTSLQDFLGINIGRVESLVNYHRLPLIRENGKARRLGRRDALLLVLMARIRRWIEKETDGFLSFREAGRRLQVSYPRLEAWPRAASRSPYFGGVPLWVRIGKRHAVTKRGFQGLLRELERRRPGPGEVSLWEAVKARYGKESYLAWENRHRACVRAVLERGIPFRELDYPLKEIQPLCVVSRSRLDEIFREAEHPGSLEPGQIRPDRWYGSAAVAQALGVAVKTARRYIHDERLPSTQIFDSRWVSGVDLLRFIEKGRFAPSAGAEEFPVPPAPYPPLIVRVMLPQDYGDDATEGEVMVVERLHPKPQGYWKRSDFLRHAVAGQALIAKDRDGRRIAGFLVFASRLNRIEILNLSVHPDYRGSGAVERALVERFRDLVQSGTPITLIAHEEDSVTLAMMKRLGTTSRLLQGYFPAGTDGIKRDGIEFTLQDQPRAFVPLAVSSRRGEWELDAVVRDVRNRAASGALLISTAAVRVFEVLEEVIRKGEPFSNWSDAYALLFDADRAKGLGIARPLVAFMKEAAKRARRGGDPRPDLARRLARFQESADGDLPSEYFQRRWAGDLGSGLEEEREESQVPPNLTIRFMYGADYGWGVERAPVLSIQERNPMSGPWWEPDRFHGYAQMDHAFVAQDAGPAGEVAGFILFEPEQADEEDVVPVPDRVEIVRWGVDPDYWESGAVERELVRALQEHYPGLPLVMKVEPTDRNSQEMLTRLGFSSRELPERLGGRIEFVLWDGREGPVPGEGLDLKVREIWNRATSGDFPLETAAVEILQALERAAGSAERLTDWRSCWEVLTLADDELGLGGAVAFRMFARRAMHLAGAGQDPRPALAGQIEAFRRRFNDRSPSEYLKERFRLGGPSAGMEEGREGMSRREWLRLVTSGVSMLRADWERFLGGELERLFSGAEMTPQAGGITEAMVYLVGWSSEDGRATMDFFKRDPIRWFRESQARMNLIEKYSRRPRAPRVEVPPITEEWVLSPWRGKPQEAAGWVEWAEAQPGASLLRLPESMAEPMLGRRARHLKGAWQGGRVDAAQVWAWQLDHTLQFEKEDRRTLAAIQAPRPLIERADRHILQMEAYQRSFGEFLRLPPEEQKRFLVAALKMHQARFEALADEMSSIVRREFPRWLRLREKEIRWQRQRVEKAVSDQREFLRSVRQAVPDRSLFVALVPADQAFSLDFVDDWAMIRRMREDRGWPVTLVREDLEKGEDSLQRAMAVAGHLAESGFEGHAGIALGVVSHGDAGLLMRLEMLHEELHSAHPGFMVSFLFTFREAIVRAQTARQTPVPSLSSWFGAWWADPVPGLMHVLPGLALPNEVWDLFQERMDRAAGLEQAA